jgi:thiamine pyrophosphate-dependent acetolactate synthase large subunit-like protein
LIQENTKDYGQYYLANCSSVDGQAAFRGEQSHHRHIEYFQSLERLREDGLPNSLPAEVQVEVDNDADLLEFAKHIQTAITEDGVKDAKRCWANAWKRLQQKRLRKHQKEWLKKRRKWKITSRDEESTYDPLKEDLFHDICELIPERKCLATVIA